MKGLLLNFWSDIGEFFLDILDLIPKFVYLLFAAFTSGIDALQCMIRKLAGLDVYYQRNDMGGIVVGGVMGDGNGLLSQNGGEAMFQKDPLTEFIYGILGIGNSSAAYQALSTVFWSLSIFAIILLAVSTMIAMIKSHYNEDTAGTSPWKFIYTALKAILTYAIIPVVVIFGLKLSSFALTTLDNITAGSATEEEIVKIYGSKGSEVFQADTIPGTDKKSYTHYDFFDLGVATNNTPISGMLFKAASYSCNRARTSMLRKEVTAGNEFSEDDVIYDLYLNIKDSNGIQIFGGEAYGSLTSEEEKKEYIAYQIDYAFANHLELKYSLSKDKVYEALKPSTVRYNSAFDLFGLANKAMGSFSKYNVNLVWSFYNLWTFNYIVAFGGAVTVFGILLSIIVGLMSRLIKGAALFLVYPPLLGLAPLDNFKAFKGWGQNIVQQILMSFGAIIGMNVLFLLLPYLNNISFFNIALIDYIISMIILVVGLVMVKDFISMVSGFVSGADANAVGGGMKADVGSTIEKGATITGKTAFNTGRTLWNTGGAALKLAKTLTHDVIPFTSIFNRSREKSNKINALNAEGPSYENDAIMDKGFEGGLTYSTNAAVRNARGNNLGSRDAQVAAQAIERAKAEGKDENQQNAAARIAVQEYYRNTKTSDGKNMFAELQKNENEILENMNRIPGNKDRVNKFKALKEAQGYEEQVVEGKLKLNSEKDENGVVQYGARLWKDIVGESFASVGQTGLEAGKSLADGFLKGVGSLGESTGLDKMFNGIVDTFKQGFTWKGGVYENKDLEGDKLQADIAKKEGDRQDAQTGYLKDIAAAMNSLQRTTEASNKFQENTFTAINKLASQSQPTTPQPTNNNNNNNNNGNGGTNN